MDGSSSIEVPRMRVGVVGGGPGGLFTALMLNRYAPDLEVTIFEASERLGGKVKTCRLPRTGAVYEAGAAELYDYSHVGEDPLRALVADLGLDTLPVEGGSVFFEGHRIDSENDLALCLGEQTARAIADHTRASRSLFSPSAYFDEDFSSPRSAALAAKRYAEQLCEISDATARRYIEIVAHSDVAAEPHATSAMYGVQNWLMNFPDYMRLYTVRGGLSGLVEGVAARICAQVRLGHEVRRIQTQEDGRYRLIMAGDTPASGDLDAVVLALPMNHLTQLQFDDLALRKAMARHNAHYDHPGAYLRISLAFERPFWRDHVAGAYFMLDAFGGCCVYDESARHPPGGPAVLGWLLAGDAAVTYANLTDTELVEAALASLPAAMQSSRPQWLEAVTHRWVGAINGWPMGSPIDKVEKRHRPAPAQHPRVFVVGDYLFDSTLNGVLDSAELVADLISETLVLV